MRRYLLFCHSFTGCDTTSAFFGKDKKQAWTLLKTTSSLREKVNTFLLPNAEKQDIISAGEMFAIALYDNLE